MSPISEREYLSEGNLPMVVSRHEESVKHGFWPKLIRVLASLPFAEEVVAAYYCAFDPATPRKAKGILLAALAYFILPFDVIPDFILGLGFTDDMAVLLTAVNMIRTHMNQSHRDKAHAALERIRRSETMA
jgi:uncharacterized membrane protein YkvA (DUF1232 family)